MVASERYEVDNDGAIVFMGGGSVVGRLDAGDWIEVRSLGVRLSNPWPSPKLPLVMDSVATRLGVHYGHYVHALRELDRFEGWQLNELDELTTAVLAAIGEDPNSSDNSEERADVRDLIARGFGIPV